MKYQNKNNSAVCQPPRRRGFTLIEMMVAGVLMMTVTMIVVPAIYWVHRERRQTEYRQIALIEVENLMERITALPFNQVSQTTVDKLVLSESALRQLPEPNLEIVIRETDALPPMKKIEIQLSWNQLREISAAPVRLTSWVGSKEKRE